MFNPSGLGAPPFVSQGSASAQPWAEGSNTVGVPRNSNFGARSLDGPPRLAVEGTTRAVSQQHTTTKGKIE
jgi:hypothetical protein